MCGANRKGLIATALAAVVFAGCDASANHVDVPDSPGRTKTAASKRALRRAFDGAPPVIAHQDLGTTCTSCHNDRGVAIDGVGFAPPMPHGDTAGLGSVARCQQCHVFKRADTLFVENDFVGYAQDLRNGARAYSDAPPVMPHPVFMRENCRACHDGKAAREEIRTPHPERERCTQCHVQQVDFGSFTR